MDALNIGLPGHISRASYKSNVGKKGELVYKNDQHLPKAADRKASKLMIQLHSQDDRTQARTARLQKKLEYRNDVQGTRDNAVELNSTHALNPNERM